MRYKDTNIILVFFLLSTFNVKVSTDNISKINISTDNSFNNFDNNIKKSLFNASETKKVYQLSQCSLFKTKIVMLIIQEIKNYYNEYLDQTNSKCLINILNEKNKINVDYFLKNKKYSEKTEKLENFDTKINNLSTTPLFFETMFQLEAANTNNYSNNKCFICGKTFKKRDLLIKHWQLFHLRTEKVNINDNNNNNENNDTNTNEILLSMQNFCLADYCNVFNCNRYIEYLYGKDYLINDKDYSLSSVNDREFECKKELLPLYKASCMNLLSNCFDRKKVSFEDEKILVKDFYEVFCMKINCEFNSSNNILKLPGSSYIVIKMIFSYLVFVFILVYVIIIWVSKLT